MLLISQSARALANPRGSFIENLDPTDKQFFEYMKEFQ
jgi:hypothetical protein